MESQKPKLLRMTTVPMSLNLLLRDQMRFMSEHGFDVHMASANGAELAELQAREGVEHHSLPLERAINPIKDLQALWQTYRLIRQLKPDIVHTHTPKAGLIGMLAASLARVPIRIHTVAGMPLHSASGARKRLLLAMEKLTYSAAHCVWPNSASLLAFIKDNKLTSNTKTRVIARGSSNGIDLTAFSRDTVDQDTLRQIKKTLAWNATTRYFVFVGRLVGDKGINELVSAFESLQSNHDNIQLVLVGPEEAELDPLAAHTRAAIESNPEIHTVGYSSNVAEYLSLADYCVFPSHREGFPNVPMQAGAMACPLICSDIGANLDVTANGENAILHEAGNTASLQNAMQKALQDKPLTERLAAQHHKNISTHFKREAIHSALLYEYNSVLNGWGDYSNELRLLLLCLGHALDAKAQAPSVAAIHACTDWPRFILLSKEHKVLELIHHSLQESELYKELPEDVALELGQAAKASAMKGASLTLETVRLTERLNQQGIDTLLIKGAALASYYKDSSHRHAGDIDLLLRDPAQIIAADILLQDAGYERILPTGDLSGSGMKHYLKHAKDLIYRHKAKQSFVELHFRLFRNQYTLPISNESLWENRRAVSIAGRQVQTLGHEHTYVYALAHGNYAQWRRLKWLCDIPLVLSQLNEQKVSSSIAPLLAELNLARISSLTDAHSQHCFSAGNVDNNRSSSKANAFQRYLLHYLRKELRDENVTNEHNYAIARHLEQKFGFLAMLMPSARYKLRNIGEVLVPAMVHIPAGDQEMPSPTATLFTRFSNQLKRLIPTRRGQE